MRAAPKREGKKSGARPTFYEFFAGGGMARAGLGAGWECLFANDFDPEKCATYASNWGADHLKPGDVAALTSEDLPGFADLAWASFPCQDLSLAGAGAGLSGARSGAFWPFWRLIETLAQEGRSPSLIAIENVGGALTSHGGKDFAAIGSAIAGAGYRFGAVIVDGIDFVPQSRPRLFIIAVHRRRPIPKGLTQLEPSEKWHPGALIDAHKRLCAAAQESWVWWRLPLPPARTSGLADVIEANPSGGRWHSAAETQRLLSLMSPLHLAKVEAAKKEQRRMVGAVYKRTRHEGGAKVQRAEIRFDNVAGCLRTPAGGSSRQTIMIVEGGEVRSRLLSPREAARLMGLPDSYKLPESYNEAYHLAGDGVVVPAVRFIAKNILDKLASAGAANVRRAA
jgi:DNA (cytosine-5)-methyltransferase 1